MLNTSAVYTEREVSEGRLYSYEFVVDEKKYIVEVVITVSGWLRVSFSLAGKGTGIYNTGDAFKVLSIVYNILQDASKKFNLKKISFNSHLTLSSRVKLYNRFCQYLSRKGLAECSFEDDSRYREYEVIFN